MYKRQVLDAARAVGGVGNFVMASTSSVYGNTQQIPFVETDPCDRPLQPYAAAKRAAEILGYTYHYLFGQNFTVLRFFTVYGNTTQIPFVETDPCDRPLQP